MVTNAEEVNLKDVTPDNINRVIASEEVKDGWTPKLKLKSNISIGSSQSVVGQVDGDSTTLGVSLDSGLDYKSGQNEWRQELKYSGATTRTPSLPRYVKSADELNYLSTYLRKLESMPNLGPYFRIEATKVTSIQTSL